MTFAEKSEILKRLYNLLQSEENQYKQEIDESQETPEDIRNKMLAKLQILKEEKERERLEEVKKREERRFYESADELRKCDSEAFAMECYLEQENQMLEKLTKLEREKMEEHIYVKLYEYDIRRKEERERQEKEQKLKMKREIFFAILLLLNKNKEKCCIPEMKE